jgi:tRNA1(Val) A37 N6-methylase TrmN6
MFFDDYPRFYESSETGPSRHRLNLRHEAIFAENRDIFADAHVLDIASHDGRWSLAALKSGASSVTGVEAKQDLVEQAEENLFFYGYSADQFRFISGDVLEALGQEDIEADVVLCLGYFYHTLRHSELLHRIRMLNPRYLILDTEAEGMRSNGRPAVVLRSERVSRQGNAVADKFSWGDKVIVGRPNLKAITMMLGAYDFEVERLSDWGGILRDNPDAKHVKSYATQTRVTIRSRRSER